jgi:phosphoglycolate phosphatase
MMPDRPLDWPPVQGVIFDLDGTLVDSRLDFDAMRRDMGLPPGLPILEALDEVPEGAAKQRMHDVLAAHELEGADRATLFPGARCLLAQLRQAGLPLGLMTRNSRASTEHVLSKLELSLTTVVTRDDAPPKPNPHGLLWICQQWNIAPAAVVMCGDYRFDLEAGCAAGMRTILFWPESDETGQPRARPEFATLADAVISHLSELALLLAQWSPRLSSLAAQ